MSREPALTDDEILEAAHQLATPEEQEAFLREAVGIDDSIQERAEQLLAARLVGKPDGSDTADTSGSGQFMAVPPALAELRLEQAGQRLGHYTLVEQIGEGGFGTVWKARQEEPVQRAVALKIIKPGMDTREVLVRFERERQALAMMDHPGIAKVFDAGASVSGRPFFVMELIAGTPVTKYCDDKQLDTTARLRLVGEICAAVQHAHQKGIIHRDIKPSNILVAESDAKPVPKVIDFGIAKAIAPDTGGTVRTQSDQFIGTPAYMSPEQASYDGQDVDTRSDVYAIGVLLYQLLTGTTPFESRTSRGTSLDEIRRIIRDEDPPPPSTAVGRLKQDALTKVLKTRKTALRQLSLLLRRDLDWIVMKALEKDPGRRYESAAALAADIRRYLTGEAVLARPPSFSYRAGKFVRKRKGAVAAVTAVLLALAGGLAASTTMYFREKSALSRLQVEAARSARTTKFLNAVFSGITPDEAKGKDTELLHEILANAAKRIGKELAGQPEVEAFLRNTIGAAYLTLGLIDEAREQFDAGMKLAAQHLGAEDRVTLLLRGNFANILHAERNYPEAEAENRAILAIRERVFGPEDEETLATRDNLANEISKQERYAEAVEEYRKILEIQQRVLGPKHPDTLRSRMALANTMTRLDQKDPAKLADAAAEYRATIAGMEDALGKDHTLTLEARYGLGDVLLFQGKNEEAEAEHRACLELRKKVLPPGHKKIYQSRVQMAMARAQQGHVDEAITEVRSVIAEQNAAPKPDKKSITVNQGILNWMLTLKPNGAATGK